MADVRAIQCWVEQLRAKKEKVRRCRKKNLRLDAILSNAIEKNTNHWKELRNKEMQQRIHMIRSRGRGLKWGGMENRICHREMGENKQEAEEGKKEGSKYGLSEWASGRVGGWAGGRVGR
jgi:hypothetical protein